MKNEELLFDFIEGNLNPALEDELFVQLSVDKNLRFQLKKVLQLDEAVKDNSRKLIPSPEVKARLFSSLGFSAPEHLAHTPFSSAKNGLVNFGNNYIGYLTASFVASIVTVIILLSFLNKDNLRDGTVVALDKVYYEQINKNHIPVVTSEENQEAVNNNKDNAEAVSSSAANNNVLAVTDLEEDQNNSIIPQASDDLSKPEELLLANNVINEPVFVQVINNSPGIFNGYNNLSLLSGNIDLSVLKTVAESDPDLPEYFTFELAKINFNRKNVPFVQKPENHFYDDISMALLFNFSDYFSAGLEVKNDYFFKDATAYIDSEDYLIYKEHANTWSLKAVAKYNLNYFGRIIPYIRVSAGLNTDGYVAGGTGGIAYKLTDLIAFFAGYEYGRLWYKIENLNFSNDKTGLIYGISLSI